MLRSVTFLLIFLSLSTTNAYAAQARMGGKKSSATYKIYVDIGYQLPARGKFREIYGSTFEFGGTILRSVTPTISVGLQASYIGLESDELPLKYSSKSIVPTAMFRLYSTAKRDINILIGFGLNFRKIEAISGNATVTQTDYGNSWIIGLAGGHKIGDGFLIGVRTQLNYITDPDPDRGDFGNTGGFNFVLRFGYIFH